MNLQVGRDVLPWNPEGSPVECCRKCQAMLEAVENKSLAQFDARFRSIIGRVDCVPSVTPPGTACSTPCPVRSEELNYQQASLAAEA